ncbi:hypothetical protein K450DRAFT_230036 [Umbelopsis ramanniana AG]|uniref:GDP/GTP exchange factor Sec2 N-terminal domain-containing protein n=1 Tax=Umbelopsis ramanniana AG TaxID=1314678 RepID=A0AAD5EDK8_UMBRA|nr:uncharacterized protein K450DRAFT_230036 [Umbelopsis ramanniana AG]KAI8581946.1 hypothetical protein K450DRAFT_230036 [Umbelopsis ramanniana AG]
MSMDEDHVSSTPPNNMDEHDTVGSSGAHKQDVEKPEAIEPQTIKLPDDHANASKSLQKNEDITANDIANLYSRLQAVIEHVPKSTGQTNVEASMVPLPVSPDARSPSASSPLPARKPKVRTSSSYSLNSIGRSDRVECPCAHILVSSDSKHCALCDQIIPAVERLQNDKAQELEEIKHLQQKLKDETESIKSQSKKIEDMTKRIEELEDDLDAKTDAFMALQNDMELLNEKYVDEIERVAEIQHSKDMVENELEDLSRRLFEEANGMVANEKREKYNLEVAQRHLENQLKETRDRLHAEQMQLKELRIKMEEMELKNNEEEKEESDSGEQAKRSSSAMSDAGVRGLADMTALLNGSSKRQSQNGADLDSTATNIDDLVLGEFQDFIATGRSLPLKKLHTNSFMKNCQAEDVEPCLRFGPNPRLSAKKIIDAIVMNKCFIEEAPVGFADQQANRPIDVQLRITAQKSMIWERFSGNTQGHFKGCQACGRNDGSPLPFRFRIAYYDDWACIDRYCRDRLVAVCEFYVFVRNARQGYYNSRSIHDLYQESIRLRLQMFYARMGTLPVMVRNAGHKSDTIGIAQLPQMEIPPARSESTLSSLEDVSSASTPVISNETTIQATESSDRQSDDQEERSHPHIPTSNIA